MSQCCADERSPERGQVLVLTALFMVVLLLAAALAIDYSSWLSARRDYQSVVDAAALAGAGQLPPPGFGTVTAVEQENAATDALVYLSDHLGWGIDRASAQGATSQYLNQSAPYVVTVGSHAYCVWIWTPTPLASSSAGTDPGCAPASSALYSPANYPGSSHRVFVRIQDARPSFFAGFAGITSEFVSAIAVAGTVHSDYAVIALKPRLKTPDNVLGLTINGNTTHLVVPIGDVGSNFSASCDSASNKGAVTFPTSSLEQTLDVEEPPPTASCTNANITGGVIELLPDYPIPDPDYFTPRPTWCTGPYSGQCQEPSGGGTASWPWAAALKDPLTNNSVIYPACATGNDPTQNKITNCKTDFTIYPGKYEYVIVPGGVTATLSPNCYGDAADLAANPTHTIPDTDCITNGRAGVFYFTSNASKEGIAVQNNGVLEGCGVLTVFDPNENGGSRMQFNVSNPGAAVFLNDPAVPGGCTMKWDPGHVGGTTAYKWYGYNQPFQSPVTMWVRPNRNGYNLTSTNNGSNVITFNGGSTLFEGGAIYAPEDNTAISGGPAGSGVGQIVAWTITYSGGTNINETYQGPGIVRSRLWQ
jgi:hypothetical protein